jgi:hypothetical protein
MDDLICYIKENKDCENFKIKLKHEEMLEIGREKESFINEIGLILGDNEFSVEYSPFEETYTLRIKKIIG